MKLIYSIAIVGFIYSCSGALYKFERVGYNGVYSEKYGQSIYVNYLLTRDCAYGNEKRASGFKEDTLTIKPLLQYYKSSGFDRGHLRPADHSRCSNSYMKSTFTILNISPQLPTFNRGIWKNIESLTKNYLSVFDSIEVYTGPIFKGRKKYLDGRVVRIPSAFFKSVKLNDSLFTSFIVPHYAKLPIEQLVVSVNEIERITKIDLFPGTSEFFESKIDSTLLYNNSKN